MFIDEVVVMFKAGKGGDGIVSWRREKCIPKGGPYGGNGGAGGNVVLVSSPHLHTLSDFRHTKTLRAQDGEKGGIKMMTGANGSDLIVPVPTGTIVTNAKTGERITDLETDGQTYLLCRGGRGGYGNSHFASSTRQAPAFAELGDNGGDEMVKLELKLVADVGIIGLPNAGKSTFISVVTHVRPKIADYPFTTLIPNLGVMEHKNRAIVLEDVPGLIAGASEGKGLGIQFLKHIERTEVLLHLVAMDEEANMLQGYDEIRKELEAFGTIKDKKEIIVLSKTDLVEESEIQSRVAAFKKRTGNKLVFPMCAIIHEGVEAIQDLLIREVPERVAKTEEILEEATGGTKIYDLKDQIDVNKYKITRPQENEFLIEGERIEQIVRMTNMSNREAVRRVFDVLDKIGAIKKIMAQLETKPCPPASDIYPGPFVRIS